MQDTNVYRCHSLFYGTALLILLFPTLRGICFGRERKDIVQFTNGDRVTCEIKKLEKGYLYVKPVNAEGTIAMDWSKVARVESSQGFVVADKEGRRYTGSLRTETEGKAPEELMVEVTGASANPLLAGNEIVNIVPTDTALWQNLHGTLDVGLNYSKQQSRTQYNFQSNAIFQRTKWSLGGSYQSSFSGGGGITDLRNDLRLNVARQLLSPQNFYSGLADFLQSDEQQLRLRTTFGGVIGHLFRNTNNSFISGYGGADWNHERYSANAPVGRIGDSAEVILGTQVNFFRFRTTNILADARVYPSLTELGRVRFDLNTSLKLRVAKEMYWRLGYYLNFDSRPPQNLPKTDYGSTSSLGWTF